MKQILNQSFDAERALYELKDALVENCRFEGPADGESAMKETKGLTVRGCFFDLRYPLWHTTGTALDNCDMTANCRAALWYDRDVSIANCRLHGIKALRECEDCRVEDSNVISPEFGWKSRGISLKNTSVEGEYPFLDSRDLTLEKVRLKGKYSFQYVENMTITDSVLDTKDAFWHTKNVTVKDSVIKGEYLGWYSENLTLIRCKIIGTQPLCYCKNLVLEDCETEGCDLSFERSTVRATLLNPIVSVKNPLTGRICAPAIGEIILDEGFAEGENRCEIIVG